MADPGQVYHNSGTPPLIYYMGKAYIGGMVDTTIKDDIGFIIPVSELGTSQTNMICTELGTLTEYTGGDMS